MADMLIYKKSSLVFLLLLCMQQSVFATTLVYNLKIRRSFSVYNFFERKRNLVWLFSAVPIVYARKRHIVLPQLQQNLQEKTFVGGSIFNIRCLAPKDWWAELTLGVERQTTKVRGTQHFKISRTGLDDIILTAGKNFLFKNNSQIGFYGLAGFPARTKVTPLEATDILVGTRFFGTGFGAEGSYSVIASRKRVLTGIVQTRFIHFFDRNWFPILPCDGKIKPGNVTDLFLLLHYREKKDIFEIGYNPTFFTQQSACVAGRKIPTPSLTRNSFYSSYSRLFSKSSILKKSGIIGCGLTISRENRFDSKIVIFWANLSLLF